MMGSSTPVAKNVIAYIDFRYKKIKTEQNY